VLNRDFLLAAGRETRYTYIATFERVDGVSTATGIAKIDLSASAEAQAVAGRIEFGRGRQGGEAVFVPRSPEPGQLQGEI
jgi:carotenoid cleavage dioxygenase-like enzyme